MPSPHRRTLRGWLYASLQALRGFPFDRFARELAAAEALPQAEFDRRCADRLEAALEFARSEVPLYGTGEWARVRSQPGIASWPLLDRRIIQQRHGELRPRQAGRSAVTRGTSGSSGSRVEIALSREAEAWGWAHRYRALLWHGIPVGAQTLRLSHRQRPLRDFLLAQACFTGLGEPGAVDAALAYLRGQRPLVVAGPPSELFFMARGLRERGLAEPAAPFARVGGEQLFEFQRAAIERYLGARALDSYGCTEIGPVAGECAAGSLHVYADHVHLEIFDGAVPARPGEFGDVVLTALRNRAMPLVRYRVGDRARLVPGGCRCGLPHAVIADLQARADDLFASADRVRRHASDLVRRLGAVYASPDADGVRQIQFEQLAADAWRIWVERRVRGGASAALEERLAALLREAAGSGCRVEFRTTDCLPRVNGKFKYYRLLPAA